MRHRLPLFLSTVALVLAGCGSADPADPAPSATTDPAPSAAVGSTPAATQEATEEAEATQEAAAFPRTVSVPAGRELPADEVTLDSEPRRVAALTYEAASAVAGLGAGDRLVLVPEQAANAALSNDPEVMAAVEHHIVSESSIDPEAVIAAAPDLVVLNDRHGLEAGVGTVLEQAGIPVLVLPNTWSSVADMNANIELVGQALGLDAAAEELTAQIDTGLVDESRDDGPRVLVLSNQAGRPFVTAGGAFPLELLRLAGAQDASQDLGMVRSGPITAEQVLAAEPDRILLIDMNGSGDAIFQPLLSNPAVAALPALTEHEPLLLEGRQVQALGLSTTVEGRDRIAEWISE